MIEKEHFIIGTFDTYDEKLLKNSLTIEGNVCGCLLSDLTVYDDAGLEPNSFLTKHGRMIFSICQQMREKGLSNFDEISFITNCNEEVRNKVDDELGGFKALQNLINSVSMKNWDVFLDDLNKRNTILSLYTKGFNVTQEITLNNGKKVIPYELFEKFTSSQVIDWYEAQITGLSTKICSSKIVEEAYVDFDDAFLESLIEQEEIGQSFGSAGENINGETIHTFEHLSRQIMGLKSGTLSAFAAASGVGKSTWLVGLLMSLISDGNGHKVCLVSNESQCKDIKIQFLSWFCARYLDEWKITKTKLISGNLTEEEKKIVKRAKECFRKKYGKSIKIVTLADADSNLTCQILKNAILREGVDIVCVDTFKISFDSNSKDNFWLSLVADTRALAELALKYDVIGLMTVQLAINSQNRSWLTADCLSTSKAIKEVLSNLILIRQAVPSLEFDQSSPYFCAPFRSKMMPDGTWGEEPYLPDPTKAWRIIFVNKARRGPTSDDTGVAYLSRFDPEHSSFFETAKCRPCRKTFNTDAK